MRLVMVALGVAWLSTSSPALAQRQGSPSPSEVSAAARLSEGSLPRFKGDDPAAAPTAPPPPPPPVPTRPVVPGELRGSAVYVYSFVDLRQGLIGVNAVKLFEAQLIEALRGEGVSARLLRYSDTSAGRNYPPQIYNSTWVPIGEVIRNNLGNEAALDARYRLIVFPISAGIGDFVAGYRIRWQLIDARSLEQIWSYEYHGRHVAIGGSSKGRAKKLVAPAIDSLRRAGLF